MCSRSCTCLWKPGVPAVQQPCPPAAPCRRHSLPPSRILPLPSRLPPVSSVRDLLAWAGFIAATAPRLGLLPAYAHGAHLVLLDGIGLGVGLSAEAAGQLRSRCHAFLLTQLPPEVHPAAEAAAGRGAVGAGKEAGGGDGGADMAVDDAEGDSPGRWGIPPFYVDQRPTPAGAVAAARVNFRAPTTGRNALRVLRALQLRKPILLEGSPGVGKTSLIAAMARAVGELLPPHPQSCTVARRLSQLLVPPCALDLLHTISLSEQQIHPPVICPTKKTPRPLPPCAGAELVRINLSEQTDMMDLLGADLPVAGGAPGQFAW